jgi:DNA-binding protein H-NS
MDINYIKLGFTLFTSITLAGLTIDGIEFVFASISANAALKEAKVELSKFEDQLKSQQIHDYINAQQAKVKYQENIKKQNIENQRLLSIRKTNDDTCRYWTSELRKNKSDYNLVNQQAACKRAAND